jgi:hypothetical protein
MTTPTTTSTTSEDEVAAEGNRIDDGVGADDNHISGARALRRH